MKAVTNDFDFIASFYTMLAKLFSLNRILISQKTFLAELKPGMEVLIIGGGSGEILQLIDKLKIPLSITFLDSSSRMISIAERNSSSLQFLKKEFINVKIENYESDKKFDAILCPFIFDLFMEKKLENIVSKIQFLLSAESILMVTDFYNHTINKSVLKKIYIRLIFIFFIKVSNIESRVLPDYERILEKGKFKKLKEEFFLAGMIKSSIYKKLS